MMEIAGSGSRQTGSALPNVEAIDAIARVRVLLKALLVALPALLGVLALWAASRS